MNIMEAVGLCVNFMTGPSPEPQPLWLKENQMQTHFIASYRDSEKHRRILDIMTK